jgi:hypothetical protein
VLTSLSDYISVLLNKGTELFTELGNKQAEDTVEEVLGDAQGIYAKKTALRNRLKSKHIEKEEFRRSTYEIADDVNDWEYKLSRFAQEISNATHQSSSDLHNAISKHTQSKIDDLRAIGALDISKEPEREKAISLLDSSMGELVKIEHGLECLDHSIQKGKLQCDPKTFRSSDSAK